MARAYKGHYEVDAAKFEKTLQEMLADYGDDIKKLAFNAVPLVAKTTKSRLAATSPHRTGKYARGWRTVTEQKPLYTESAVHNATNYQLTHLLENGHAYWVYRGRTRGWEYTGETNSYPHIAPAQEWANEEVAKMIEENITKL